jgi:hypothetical protein
MKHLASVVVLVLGSSAALAGLVQSVPVTVTLDEDGSGSANGNMVTARAAANAVEYIGCGVRKVDNGIGGATAFGFCQASSADSVEGFCSTDNVELLQAIQSISDYSYVTFSWNIDGVCQLIGNSTQSFYIP